MEKDAAIAADLQHKLGNNETSIWEVKAIVEVEPLITVTKGLKGLYMPYIYDPPWL